MDKWIDSNLNLIKPLDKYGKELKAPYSTKIDILLSKKGLIIDICINTIIKYGIWQPVKFQLVSRSWNEMFFFFRISELIIKFSTLIQRYDKNHFVSDPVQKQGTNWYLSDATFDDCINTIYQFIKPFLDKNVYFLRI